MTTPTPEVQTLARAAMDALRRGDARAARDQFEQIINGGFAEASVWVGLALAHRRLKDTQAMLAALNQALVREPRNLRALILKGDALADQGHTQRAASFYLAALRAATPGERLAPDLVQELARAKTLCDRYAAQYRSLLTERLAAAGFKELAAVPRFAEALDILSGGKQIYFQEPRRFFFPGLPQIQFYERRQFPWVEALELQTASIRAELEQVLKRAGAFSPYVQSARGRQYVDAHGMLDNENWGAYYIWKNGELDPQHAKECAGTLEALAPVPHPQVKSFSPIVMFSLLRPKTRIPPHTGFFNTRLICHLPLIVPEGCALRVGNEIRAWREGKALIFDDTIEHEAWNESSELRVVLLFDLWRPELSAEERALVSALFDAVTADQPEDSSEA